MDPAFEFVNCSYTVMVKNKGEKTKVPRVLINNVSASIPSGMVLAVMGPSGAGKTTLLSMLMLDRVGGKPEGVVKLGGHDFTLDLYTKHCAVVTQHDCLWWALTVREHLHHALNFYQPSLTGDARTKHLDELLDEMGLTAAQHTRAGNAFVKGLSGGQKRRLSLAIALCKQPLVVFLDEPTSGLDSAAAASIMKFLKKVAEDQRIAIFCTIHSPSAAVFGGFDQAFFLSGGKPAYLGPGAGVPDYIRAQREALPPNTNPADRMLDLINKDFSEPAKVDRLVAAWRAQQPRVEPMGPVVLPDKPRASWPAQVAFLLARHGALVRKDPTLYLGRLFAFPMATIFFAIIYIDTRNRKQETAQERMFLAMWYVGVPAMLGLVAVFSLNQELISVRREIKDGMYSASAYTLATTLLQVPLVYAIGLFVTIPAAYPIANWPWDKLHVFWIMLSTCLLTFEQAAQLFSLLQNPLLGMMGFMNCWFAFFLFSGVFFDAKDVIWPFRALDYFSPMRLAFPSLVWAALVDESDYSGAELCDPATFADCNEAGFYCNATSGGCFGVTGSQILDSLSLRYPALSSDVKWAESLGVMLGVAAAFKLCYAVLLALQMRRIDLPAAPAVREASTTEATELQPKPDAEPGPEEGQVPAEASTSRRSQPHSMERATSSSFNLKAKEADFVFKDCTYTVMVKAKGEKAKVPRVLLDNVSGAVAAGSVLAIMGPSGAGKTTLLNMLMLEEGGGVPEGTITLGGHDFTLDKYTKHACVVQQTDQLWWPLSPRDHITYAVRLFQSAMPAAEQLKLVDSLIKNTGLTSAQSTRAGNAFFKGLSGGQKRRLSLAIAMAKRPHVIFLDEPTSGLDAAAAASIMHYLKIVALGERIAILCTIHQPSTGVFDGFDKVLFLTAGQVAYCGEADGLAPFLMRSGRSVAASANPADFMLDLINKDFGGTETMEAVVSAWRNEEPVVAVPELVEVYETKLPSIALQLRVLFGKASRLLLLDPISYLVRGMMFMGACVFFAIIYIESRNREQSLVIDRLWFSMWCVGVTSALGVVVIYLMNTDYQVVKREVKDGMYHPLSYVLAQTCLSVPMLAFMSLLAMVPALYPIANWEVAEIGRVFIIWWLTFLSFEAMAELLSVAFANPLIGMLVYIVCWFAMFLFCGVLVEVDRVIWPFRLLAYVSPLRWAFGQFIWAALLKTPDYDGTAACDIATGNATEGALQGQPVNCPRGFYCPGDLNGVACWGKTGKQILTSMSEVWPSAIDDEDTLGRNAIIIVATAALYKIGYLVLFHRKSKISKEPKKPSHTRPVTGTSVA